MHFITRERIISTTVVGTARDEPWRFSKAFKFAIYVLQLDILLMVCDSPLEIEYK